MLIRCYAVTRDRPDWHPDNQKWGQFVGSCYREGREGWYVAIVSMLYCCNPVTLNKKYHFCISLQLLGEKYIISAFNLERKKNYLLSILSFSHFNLFFVLFLKNKYIEFSIYLSSADIEIFSGICPQMYHSFIVKATLCQCSSLLISW